MGRTFTCVQGLTSYDYKRYIGFNPLQPNISMHTLHTVLLYIFYGSDKEDLFHNQELL